MRAYVRILLIAIVLIVLGAVSESIAKNNRPGDYPDFVTSNEDYYVTRIKSVPTIDETTYRLTVKGLVKRPRSFTLEELRGLELVELPLTVECMATHLRDRSFPPRCGRDLSCTICCCRSVWMRAPPGCNTGQQTAIMPRIHWNNYVRMASWAHCT